LTETTQRITIFREDCLIRDYHRCVILRKFNDIEAGIRVGRERNDKIKNNNKHLLKNKIGTFAPLKIVYIILYSLMNVTSGKIELIDGGCCTLMELMGQQTR
jgi:hypothetical protein